MKISCSRDRVELAAVSAVRTGLTAPRKTLPPWLFYDEAGSLLFDRITELPEYYLTRTERSILTAHAAEMITLAAGERRLRIAELGAGSAGKTRLLLAAAAARQGQVLYEPVDVSPSALEAAKERIEAELPTVRVAPQVEDYTRSLALQPHDGEERRLLLYIGSSIGNFDRAEARALLGKLRAALAPGDSLLLGVDLVKDASILLPAYDDAGGVTAAFNRNILTRLNRELDADFDLAAFEHRALWNETESRMEMHLVSRAWQAVRVGALDLTVYFDSGESIHTENSCKYRPGEAEAMLIAAGFEPARCWSDAQGWFAVILGKAVL
jgi:dimethylhistidine N-methyltransferase